MPLRGLLFIPYGTSNIHDYISHEDLFSSLQTIAAANILFAYDWQDLNESNRISEPMIEAAFDKEYLRRKASFNLLQNDKFTQLFTNFIAFRPKHYHRDAFLLVKGAEQLFLNIEKLSPPSYSRTPTAIFGT